MKVNVVLAVALGVEALLIPFDGAEDPVDVGPVAPHVHEKADGPWLAAPAEVLEVPFAYEMEMAADGNVHVVSCASVSRLCGTRLY